MALPARVCHNDLARRVGLVDDALDIAEVTCSTVQCCDSRALSPRLAAAIATMQPMHARGMPTALSTSWKTGVQVANWLRDCRHVATRRRSQHQQGVYLSPTCTGPLLLYLLAMLTREVSFMLFRNMTRTERLLQADGVPCPSARVA